MPRAKVYSDIDATVFFDAFRDDYGVPGSPVWEEIDHDTMEVDSLHMFGKDWSEAELRLTFGDMGADAIRGLVFDLVEYWEND